MKKENKTMGFKQKLKRFLRKIVPAGRIYIDKKILKTRKKYIKKATERAGETHQTSTEKYAGNAEKSERVY